MVQVTLERAPRRYAHPARGISGSLEKAMLVTRSASLRP